MALKLKIPCVSNDLLDSLNAEKDKLKGMLDGLGAGAMGGLMAQANAMKAKLEGMIPEIPKLPNFKEDLDKLKGLKGLALVLAIKALKDKWGDALPDINIDDLLNKMNGIGDFDFCKDVPNIDGTLVGGKIGAIKDKGAAITTAIAIPEKVKAVIPTVIANEALPSSGTSTMPRKDIVKDFNSFVDNSLKPIEDKEKKIKSEATIASLKFMKSGEMSAIYDKMKPGPYNLVTYYNSERATPSEKTTIAEYYKNKNLTNKSNALMKKFSYISALTSKADFNASDLNDSATTAQWKEVVVRGDTLSEIQQSSDSEVKEYAKAHSQHQGVITNWNKYKNAIS